MLMTVKPLIRLNCLAGALLCAFLLPAGAVSQETHTVSGEVVDKSNHPVPYLEIKALRGAELLNHTVTDPKGRYSISYRSGARITVCYYGAEWYPSQIADISGESSHKITKVMLKVERGTRLSREDASVVMAALEFLNNNPDEFSREIQYYAFTLNQNHFPDEFRPRLKAFKLATTRHRGNPGMEAERAARIGVRPPKAEKEVPDTENRASPPRSKPLYERLGGEAAISAVIDDFVGRVAADTRINGKFAKSNIDRVKFFLKQQVCAVTGGPCKYEGLSMKQSHKNMGVTEGEFNALVEDLVMTLDKFNVPAAEKGEVLTALGGLKDQIVEVKSDVAGTPLPAKFKPAKPLPKSKLSKGPFPKKK
jgi:hemoglobin